MLDFTFQNTTKIVFGRGQEEQVGVLSAGISDTVLIVSSGSKIMQPLLERVRGFLKTANVTIYEVDGVKPNPEIDIVYRGVELCKKHKIGLVLAVGGGSAIDTAKAIALGACYEGDVWDIYLGKAQVTAALPVATVLTISAAGSESSSGTVITNPNDRLKLAAGSDLLRPAFSILNPELTASVPPWHTFCGIVDIMSHAMERYFTGTGNVDLIDRMTEGLLVTCIRNARILLDDPTNYDARAEIMLAGAIAHNDLLGVGRETDWATHWIGMAISAIYDTTHGATLSIITPAWMKHVLKEGIMRYAQFAMRVFGVEYDPEYPEITAREGIARLEAFFAEIGCPTRLSQAGILDRHHYPEMVDIYVRFGAKGSIKKLDESDAYAILALAE